MSPIRPAAENNEVYRANLSRPLSLYIYIYCILDIVGEGDKESAIERERERARERERERARERARERDRDREILTREPAIAPAVPYMLSLSRSSSPRQLLIR